MATPLRFGTAVSAIALASMVAACAAPQKATNFGGTLDKNVGLATRALAALQSNNVPEAISFGERAVDVSPNDAGYRALLGNAYFAAGRFWSAESAYKDALSLYSNQPKVILKLALVETALGKNDEAVSFLEAGRSVLDPSDYGLALALAGRAPEAVNVLDAVARQRGADAQVRQNLALAHALAGDWQQARTIAAQDVPADQLDARIQQWMQLATPKRASDQVAALVGVKIAPSDSGQPIRLALRKPDVMMAKAAPAPAQQPVVQVAMAAPAPAPVKQAQAYVEPRVVPAITPAAEAPRVVPAVAPAVEPRHVEAPVVAEAETPAAVTLAMIAAAAPEAPSAFLAAMAKVKARPAAPAARPATMVKKAMARASRKLRAGDSVVQLGAYSSPAYVNAAWARLTQRHPALKAYLPVRARYVSPKGTFWRLSIQGFGSEREAIARCRLLKNRGGSCFVRDFAGDQPVSVASN